MGLLGRGFSRVPLSSRLCGPLSCSLLRLCSRPSGSLCLAFVDACSRRVCSFYPELAMKHVPSGFLPPLKRVAQQVVVGCRYPWSFSPRPSMDEVTVVAEGLVPAVASTLLEVIHSFGRSQVLWLLRFSCTFGVCVWWPFVLLFAGFFAVCLTAHVPLLDVSLFLLDVSAAQYLDSAVSLVRFGPLPFLVVRRLHFILPTQPGVCGSRWRSSQRGAYRAAASFSSAAQDRHLAVGFKWSEFLDRSISRIVRSVSCGFGPPRLWAVLVGFLESSLELPLVSSLPGPLLGLKTTLLTGVLRVKTPHSPGLATPALCVSGRMRPPACGVHAAPLHWQVTAVLSPSAAIYKPTLCCAHDLEGNVLEKVSIRKPR